MELAPGVRCIEVSFGRQALDSRLVSLLSYFGLPSETLPPFAWARHAYRAKLFAQHPDHTGAQDHYDFDETQRRWADLSKWYQR